MASLAPVFSIVTLITHASNVHHRRNRAHTHNYIKKYIAFIITGINSLFSPGYILIILAFSDISCFFLVFFWLITQLFRIMKPAA